MIDAERSRHVARCIDSCSAFRRDARIKVYVTCNREKKEESKENRKKERERRRRWKRSKKSVKGASAFMDELMTVGSVTAH